MLSSIWDMLEFKKTEWSGVETVGVDMRSLFKLGAILIILLFSLGHKAFASGHIGRVVKVRGEVFRNNPERGQGALIKNGAKLYVGDQLISNKGSYIKVLIKDDSIFQLGPKSKFVFEKFNMKTKNDRSATYNLVSGKLRSLFTKKAPGKTLKIKTPHAAMGIRGTEILSDVYNFNGKSRTDIALMSGKLEVTSLMKGSNGQKFNLQPGDIFESGLGLPGFSNSASQAARSIPKPSLKKLPRKLFKKLKKNKKRGEVFLHDAKVQENPEIKKQSDFNVSVRSGKGQVKDLSNPLELQPGDIFESGLGMPGTKLTEDDIDKQVRSQKPAASGGAQKIDLPSNKMIKIEKPSSGQADRMKVQQQRLQGELRSKRRDQAMKNALTSQQRNLLEQKKDLLIKKQKEKIIQDRIKAGRPVPCSVRPQQPHCKANLPSPPPPPQNGSDCTSPAGCN